MKQRPDRKRIVFVGSFVVGTLALLLATRTILLPFLLALVIAYVLTPAVSLVERARVPRWLGVIVVYLVTLGVAYGFFSMVMPRLVQETIGLRDELPGLSVKLRDQWVPAVYDKLQTLGISRGVEEQDALEPQAKPSTPSTPSEPQPAIRVEPNADGSFDVHLQAEVEVRNTGENSWKVTPVEKAEVGTVSVDLAKLLGDGVDKAVSYAQKNVVEVLRYGSSIVAGVSRAVFLFFLTLMLAAYIMISREKLLDFFRVLIRPERRGNFDDWLGRIDRGLAGVVRGQLLICFVNGVLSAIGFALIGLKYWPILSVVAGVMSIIPIFGSILSSIPAVAIGLTQGIGTAVFTLAWIIGIHQVEANLLNPKIYGIAAKIHPVLVIFSLLVGEHFFGLVGALLAVPCMSIVQNTFLHARQEALGVEAEQGSNAVPCPQVSVKPVSVQQASAQPAGDEPRGVDARIDDG